MFKKEKFVLNLRILESVTSVLSTISQLEITMALAKKHLHYLNPRNFTGYLIINGSQ